MVVVARRLRLDLLRGRLPSNWIVVGPIELFIVRGRSDLCTELKLKLVVVRRVSLAEVN